MKKKDRNGRATTRPIIQKSRRFFILWSLAPEGISASILFIFARLFWRIYRSIFVNIYIMIVFIYEDLCVIAWRRADYSREINETERLGRMRIERPKIYRDFESFLPLFGYLRGDSEDHIEMGRKSKIFQNRKIDRFYHMRSYNSSFIRFYLRIYIL